MPAVGVPPAAAKADEPDRPGSAPGVGCTGVAPPA